MDLGNEPLIYKGLRNQMVEILKKEGITDINVLNAISHVPRQLFVPIGLEVKAYENNPISIGAEQTISQPFTVAKQTELLQIKDFDKVLEIGTGSGYQAAVLSEMKAAVYTIERHKELYLKSKKILTMLKYPIIEQIWGDGYEGMEKSAPFKKILITAAVEVIPKTLFAQLEIGGRLVAPVGNENEQKMTIVDKISENEFKIFHLQSTFRFVPMLQGVND